LWKPQEQTSVTSVAVSHPIFCLPTGFCHLTWYQSV
jgi:hypothetical protein